MVGVSAVRARPPSVAAPKARTDIPRSKNQTPATAASASIAAAPAALPSPARSSRRGPNACGTRSKATSISMAPAATANETGSRPRTWSTSRNASGAPTGCRALVRTAAQNGSDRLKPASPAGGDARPQRDVLEPDREDREEAQSSELRRAGGPDREALGEAVHEEHYRRRERRVGCLLPAGARLDV